LANLYRPFVEGMTPSAELRVESVQSAESS